MAFHLLILPGMVMTPILIQRFKTARLVNMVGCGISAIITVLFVVASPLMAAVLITILLHFQKVEKVNRELAAAKDKRSVTIECKRGGQYAKKTEFSMG